MKTVYRLLLLILVTSCISVNADITTNGTQERTDVNLDEAAIRLVLEQQEAEWNNHNLEGFMQGYWKSDELKFYGSSGLTLGWDNTLAKYKKSYPTKAEIGTLNFVSIHSWC